MREVRAADSFFADVDNWFPPDRGPNGEPSADDFLRYALVPLIAEISERFDRTPDQSDTPGIKAFILPGILVPAVVVYAAEMSDGIIYLIGLEIDPDSPS